jgi:hypothetical protein
VTRSTSTGKVTGLVADVVLSAFTQKLQRQEFVKRFAALPLSYATSKRRGRIRTGNPLILSHVVPPAFAAKMCDDKDRKDIRALPTELHSPYLAE